MGRDNLRRQRERLWREDPNCVYCGRETVLPAYPPVNGQKQPDNMATIEHVRSRLDPERTEPNRSNAVRRVLACLRCNNERGSREVRALPRVDLWKRAGGSTPLADRLAEARPGQATDVIACSLWEQMEGVAWADASGEQKKLLRRIASGVLRALDQSLTAAPPRERT